MNTVKNAAFKFDKYRIVHFSFSEPEDSQSPLSLRFEPSGLYNQNGGSFNLKFDFYAFLDNNEQTELLKVKMEGLFTFDDKPSLENIPSYFYRNSIAIVFPYLRAFVNSMTLLANIQPVILPVINLTGLEEIFRANTTTTT